MVTITDKSDGRDGREDTYLFEGVKAHDDGERGPLFAAVGRIRASTPARYRLLLIRQRLDSQQVWRESEEEFASVQEGRDREPDFVRSEKGGGHVCNEKCGGWQPK